MASRRMRVELHVDDGRVDAPHAAQHFKRCTTPRECWTLSSTPSRAPTTFARSGSTVTITAPHGQVTTLTCGGSCTTSYLTAFTEPTSVSTTFVHNSGGLLTSLTDPNSNVHTLTYETP